MEIEDAFGIQIPDADAEVLETVGQTYEYIRRTLRASNPSKSAEWDDQRIWNVLKHIVSDQLGVRPEEVVPTAHFIKDYGAS